MYPDAPKRDLSKYLRAKRIADVSVSAFLLIALSPVFLLIAVLIKIECPRSKIIQRSRRVGKDFRHFDFFKFCSVRPDAHLFERQVEGLRQEFASANAPAHAPAIGISSQRQLALDAINIRDSSVALFSDEGWISEVDFLTDTDEEVQFIPINKDPRLSRIGKFIQTFSLDELPQLWNVLCNDMSLVGNRPLPLEQADRLTTDEFIQRFMAPAGITGLWQVTERGRSDTDTTSRKKLDVEYAKRCSFWLDLYILLKTPAAAFHRESAI